MIEKLSAFPKLRYPIHSTGLQQEDRIILFAYDMIYKLKQYVPTEAQVEGGISLHEDIDANLANLGAHIEHIICGGDMKLRFEGYDHL